MKIALLLMLIFISGCIAAAQAAKGEINNSPAKKTERRAMCKPLCDKQHYPDVKFIRADGTLEILKIHVASIGDKIACECRF